MKQYAKGKDYTLYQGNMLDMLDVIEPESISSVITDPPYELNFMSKGWDNSDISFQPDTWKRCLEILKPGGFLLAFGGSRTFHRIAVAIEDAGFEIRDCIMWLYGSGFPKSMNIAKGIEGKLTIGSANTKDQHKLNGSKTTKGDWGYSKLQLEQDYRSKDYDIEGKSKERLVKLEPTTKEAKQWTGWGTALKPAFEPIIVARKPFNGSCIDNVLKNDCGGINIDECRVWNKHTKTNRKKYTIEHDADGRYPSNVILTYNDYDKHEVIDGFPYTSSNGKVSTMPDLSDVGKKQKGLGNGNKMTFGQIENSERVDSKTEYPCDSGSAARYFYCAKASKKDRDEGLDGNNFIEKKVTDGNIRTNEDTARVYGANTSLRKNIHPTVKPCELMQYLVRLVTARGGGYRWPIYG